MKNHSISNLLLLIAGIVVLSCCDTDKGKFKISGKFSGVGDSDTLYIEHQGLANIEIIDSVKIDEDGEFTFKVAAPENPEFYRLRLKDKVVLFAVDSIEDVRVVGDINNLFETFTVEGSPVNDQLKQVVQQQMLVSKEFKKLSSAHDAKVIDDMTYLNQIDSVLNQYKTFATKLILGNPSSAAAYYAVFQKIDDYLIFDPYNRRDYSMFGAVATSWQNYYPDTERTKHLYDFTMNALKERKRQEQQTQLLENIPVITESGLPDIVLSDMNGKSVSLSSLQGKVVLLDFTVYNAEYSPKHAMALNSLYTKYNSQGFEIYQISFDSDEHFWKNAANNLPWITLRDPQSVNSTLLSTYNVRNLPTAFLINREGDIVFRVEDYSTLVNELNRVL